MRARVQVQRCRRGGQHGAQMHDIGRCLMHIDVGNARALGTVGLGKRQARPVDALRVCRVDRDSPFQQRPGMPGRLEIPGLQPHAVRVGQLQFAQRRSVRQLPSQPQQSHVVFGQIGHQRLDVLATEVRVAHRQQRGPQQPDQQQRDCQHDQGYAVPSAHQKDCPSPI